MIRSPHTVQDKKKLEKVQMRASKLIKLINHLSYIVRLKYLNLPTLLNQRLTDDMISVYELLSGIFDSNIAGHLVRPNNYVTVPRTPSSII